MPSLNKLLIMRKHICATLFSLFFLHVYAGENDRFINAYGGWQANAFKWNNALVNVMVGLEFEGKYHNAWEIYFDASTAYKTCETCHKVCSKSFFDYKTFAIGAAYKPVIRRAKNRLLRLRVGADLGANEKGFQAGLEAGLEYSYSFRNGMQVFLIQKNDIVFWSRDHFRNGLLAGVKFPI